MSFHSLPPVAIGERKTMSLSFHGMQLKCFLTDQTKELFLVNYLVDDLIKLIEPVLLKTSPADGVPQPVSTSKFK